MQAAYPHHWEADIVARDGATVRIRPIRPGDAPALQQLHRRQSERSRYFRFFSYRDELTEEELAHFTHVDHDRRVALVVLDEGELLALGCYDAVDDVSAEVSFYVADSQHGRGLGSVLLDHLAAAGRERGFSRFVADVLPANRKMLSVFTDAGYQVGTHFDDGVVDVSIDLSRTGTSWSVMTEREHHAEALAMRAVMDPDRVVTLSPDLAATWDLPLWDGGPLDARTLAVVDSDPMGALDRLGPADAGAVLIVSDVPSALHPELLERARSFGMRVLGPGSYGVASGSANLTWARRLTLGGSIGFFAQSLRSSAEIVEWVADTPVRALVSSGQRVDLSGNDAMQWWAADPLTRVAALSLDSIGNPRKFARIARHLAGRMPVVCHIDSATGQVAPAGHVVRTSPLPRAVLTGMLRRAGVILAESHADLVALARLAAAIHEPASAVAVDGPTAAGRAYAAAELEEAGVRVDPLAPLVVVLDTVLPLEEGDAGWRERVGDRALIHVTAHGETVRGAVHARHMGEAVRLARGVAVRGTPDHSDLVAPRVDAEGARAVLRGEPFDTESLLACYGIHVLRRLRAHGQAEAVEVSRALGYPVVVKSIDERRRHRLELGGVVMDVRGDAEVVAAMERLGDDVEIQPMVPHGPVCALHAVEDPLYGPVVSFSLAGDAREIFSDVAYRIAPLSQQDAATLVREPAAGRRLPASPALEDLVGRLSVLKDDFPQIAEISLPSVVVSPQGVHVLDARVTRGHSHRYDAASRTLPSLPQVVEDTDTMRR